MTNSRINVIGLGRATINIDDVSTNKASLVAQASVQTMASPISVNFGSCNFDLKYRSVQLAQLNGKVILRAHQRSILATTGTVQVRPLLGSPGKALSLLASAASGQPLNVTVVGRNCSSSAWASSAIASFDKETVLTDGQLVTAVSTLLKLPT